MHLKKDPVVEKSFYRTYIFFILAPSYYLHQENIHNMHLMFLASRCPSSYVTQCEKMNVSSINSPQVCSDCPPLRAERMGSVLNEKENFFLVLSMADFQMALFADIAQWRAFTFVSFVICRDYERLVLRFVCALSTSKLRLWHDKHVKFRDTAYRNQQNIITSQSGCVKTCSYKELNP